MSLRSRILVCGDRNWLDYNVVLNRIHLLDKQAIIVQGECRGADLLAKRAAVELGLTFESYPADWDSHGKAAGSIRNQQMLDTGIDYLIAFHNNIDSSRGTKDMVSRARKANVWSELCYLNSPHSFGIRHLLDWPVTFCRCNSKIDLPFEICMLGRDPRKETLTCINCKNTSERTSVDYES